MFEALAHIHCWTVSDPMNLRVTKFDAEKTCHIHFKWIPIILLLFLWSSLLLYACTCLHSIINRQAEAWNQQRQPKSRITEMSWNTYFVLVSLSPFSLIFHLSVSRLAYGIVYDIARIWKPFRIFFMTTTKTMPTHQRIERRGEKSYILFVCLLLLLFMSIL